jgi:hypothetical protein
MLVQRVLVFRTSHHRLVAFATASMLTLMSGAGSPGAALAQSSAIPQDPSRLLIVDCLLPGQVRKLGGQMTYLSPRRAVKTAAVDCEIRGGEYVAYDRANYATALAVWMPQAEGGDPQAQVYVGEIFEKGLGRPADYAEAAKWYQKAAAQNFARGQMNLAYLHEQGLGVEKDPLKALNLYRLASGISDDSLVLASELTEVRSEMQRTIDGLTDQLEARNAEVLALRSDLDASQSALVSQRSALARAQGETRALQQQVVQLRSEAVVDPARVAELQKLEQELEAREQRLLREERAVADLEADTASMRSRLADQMRDAAERDLALRSELEQATQARDEVQQKLVETQRRLLATEQQAAKLTATLATERARIAADREAVALQSRGASSAAVEEQRSRAAAEIAAREASLSRQQAQIAKLTEQQREYLAEVTRLRTQLAARDRSQGESRAEVAEARSELASTQRRLAETEQRVADLTAQLEAERSSIAREREQINRRAASATSAQQGEIDSLRKALGAREAELARQQSLVASLQAESRAYQQQVQRLQSLPVERVATRSTSAGTKPKPGLPASKIPKELRIGNYYALVIGNNRYANLPNLESAVPDAQAVDELLRTRYGFRTRVLLNATRAQIISALNEYRGILSPDDSLLIYYAGHGELDTQNLRGYWLPVDAQRDENTEWISDQQVTSQIETMSARHVLVVADSCYSGAMTRSSGVVIRSAGSTDEEIKRLTRLAKVPSRTVLTSGGLQPVLDAGGGGHSIFARAFIGVLRSNDRVLEGTSLYNQLFDEVRRSAARYKMEQSPRYSALADAGHRNGEFLFIPAA